MLLNLLRYSLRQCFQSLGRNFGLGLASVGVIAVTLMVLGSFLLIAINTERLVQAMGSNVEIGVFINREAEPEEIEEELEGIPGIEGYSFVSREEGLEMLSDWMGEEEVMQDMEGENNPLPHAFQVRAADAARVPELAGQIEDIAGVEKTDYGRDLLEGILQVGRWANTVLLVAGILLAAAAVFLILTTVRLSLLSRSEEVGIMKYLGASNWFIRLPFLLEGMIIGWAGTLLAVILLGTGYHYLASAVGEVDFLFLVRPVTDPAILYQVWLGLLVAGTLIGGLGSLLSLRRFLKV